MLALTFSTGVIDAAGYLGLDRVFTGNMTGNVAILGMALAGADDLPIIGPIVALLAFVVGAAIAGRIARSESGGWSSTTTRLLAAVTGLLLLVAVLSSAIPLRAHPIAEVVTGALGLAMGIQAGAARAVAAKDVTTVVVTSTLVGLAYDSRFAAANAHPWRRRLLAVSLIGAGAIAGALLLSIHFAWSVALACVVTATVAAVGEHHRDARVRILKELS
ncbi:DUF1275 domain-containing protein [Microbacterium ureisolvens]|uniref:DUF1275 domain-containing protein n=2 Tax=Microbacterium ureisolvens TaxID=2781186 RepID=A0ABS7HZW5_9MICO|nr:DUF1275 domain-containing protein [Microbacterium ureisolvens]